MKKNFVKVTVVYCFTGGRKQWISGQCTGKNNEYTPQFTSNEILAKPFENDIEASIYLSKLINPDTLKYRTEVVWQEEEKITAFNSKILNQ